MNTKFTELINNNYNNNFFSSKEHIDFGSIKLNSTTHNNNSIIDKRKSIDRI